MKEILTDLIMKKLNQHKKELQKAFNSKHAVCVARFFVLDDLLPRKIAYQMYDEFPNIKKMRTLNNFGELKFKFAALKNTSPLLQAMHYAVQDPKVIAIVEDITGIKNQVPDQSRIAGGVSAMIKHYYLNPHLDNSHNIDKTLYRTVNLLYYLSPDWQIENGGNYHLWNETVTECIQVPSFFNRFVVMETHQKSWHSVSPVTVDAPRCCLFNYYFSAQSPLAQDYFHGAASLFFNPLFRARPEQTLLRQLDKIKKIFCKRHA